MPEDKKVQIGIGLDTSEFDRQINQITQRLRTLEQMKGAGAEGKTQFSEAAQRVFKREESKTLDEIRREFNTRDNFRRNEERQLGNVEKLLKDSTTSEEKRNKLLKEREKIEKDITKAMKEQIDLLEKGRQIDPKATGFQGAEDLKKKENENTYKKFGFGENTSKFLAAIGGPTAALATVTKAVSSGWNEMAEKQRNLTLAQGGAMQAGMRPLEEQMAGRGVESAVFGGQRQQALKIMGDEMSSRRTRDIIKDLVPTILAVAGGTAIAGPVGGVIAGVTRYAVDKQARGAAFGTQEYYSNITKEGFEKFRQVEDKLRVLDWRRTSAWKEFNQNMGLYRGVERGFGVSNPVEEGGFLRRAARGGVTQNTAFDIAKQIMGTSGITLGQEEGAESAINAFQMQQAGITNMPKIMGAIKGIGGIFGEKTTDESIKKLFAAAVKIGVDDSKMVEEFRVFGEAAANLSLKTGIKVEEAANELAKGGFGAPSALGINASMRALEFRNQQSALGAGASLQRRFAYGASEEGKGLLGGIGDDMTDMINFMGLRIDEMTENNPNAQYLMKKMGVGSIEELKRRKQAFDLAAHLPLGGTKEKLTGFAKKISKLTPQEAERSIRPGGENLDEFGGLVGELRQTVTGFSEMKPLEQIDYIMGVARTLEKPLPEKMVKSRVKKQLTPEQQKENERFTKKLMGDMEGGVSKVESQTPLDYTPIEKPVVYTEPTEEIEETQWEKQYREAREKETATGSMEKGKAADAEQNMKRLTDYVSEFASAAERHAVSANGVEGAMDLLKESLSSGAEAFKSLAVVLNAAKDLAEGKINQGQYEDIVTGQQKRITQPTGTMNSVGEAAKYGRAG